MNTDRKLLFGGAGVVGVVALSVVLFIWPNYRQAAASWHEISEWRAKIAGLESQSHLVTDLHAQIAAAQERLENLKNIPEAPDLASLIRHLSLEVDRVAVFDQTFTAGSPCEALISSDPKRAGPPSKSSPAKVEGDMYALDMMAMPLTVDMDATFESVFALIRNAESMRRLVRVASVRLQCKRDEKAAPSKDAAPPMLKASIGLEAIYHGASPVSMANGQEGK